VKTSRLLIAAAAVTSAGMASTASADAILTFGYTDLAGQYIGDASGGIFTAAASAVGAIQTSGAASRLIGPGEGVASFDTGFVGGADLADAIFTISVFNRTLNRADGAGQFVLTDVDGDVVTGTIDGVWLRGSQGRTYFNGNLRAVTVIDNGLQDGTFNGNSGSWAIGGLGGPVPLLEGALVQLFIRSGVGFFDQAFFNTSTQVAGELVPTPGAFALLGLAGLAGLRRRRA
jgi:MYXO-CTERM domain-containing protein